MTKQSKGLTTALIGKIANCVEILDELKGGQKMNDIDALALIRWLMLRYGMDSSLTTAKSLLQYYKDGKTAVMAETRLGYFIHKHKVIKCRAVWSLQAGCQYSDGSGIPNHIDPLNCSNCGAPDDYVCAHKVFYISAGGKQ